MTDATFVLAGRNIRRILRNSGSMITAAGLWAAAWLLGLILVGAVLSARAFRRQS